MELLKDILIGFCVLSAITSAIGLMIFGFKYWQFSKEYDEENK